MSLYLDLLPPPQFDRSLVSYTVGNFQRIKDVLIRASGRVYTTAVYGSNIPISWTIATPFRSDVLLTLSVGGYCPSGGLTGVNTSLDGAALSGTLLYYFNTANQHQHWGASLIVRSQAAGNHTWALGLGAGMAADGNDHPSIAFTFVEV
jgi:hypothetical protein